MTISFLKSICLVKKGNITLPNGQTSVRGKVGGIAIATKGNNIIINNCVNKGTITATASGNNPAGGILAFGEHVITITNCKNLATVTSSESNAGGILGYFGLNVGNKVTIKDCSNAGTISTGMEKDKGAGAIIGYLCGTGEKDLQNNTTTNDMLLIGKDYSTK